MNYRTNWGVRFLFASACSLLGQSVHAELSLNDSPSPAAFRTALDGPGLKLENLRFIKGIKGQYGIFYGGTDAAGSDPVLDIPNGIYLTTGSVNSILGPNNSEKYTYNTRSEHADSDLVQISPNATYDPVIIEFDIIPEGDQVNFILVFGSEEYPEYVCSKFNDVFGLFVSGPGFSRTQNAALVPGSNLPIAVNNINAGQRGSEADGTACRLSNSIYFVDNGNGTDNQGTQLDGFTRPLTASLNGLRAGERYKVKLALADAGDQAYDSSAFFKWLTSTNSETTVDLKLEAEASTLRPSADGFVDVRYTVSNTSAQATRLVEVGIDLPVGTMMVSEDSAGAFDSLDGVWKVGNLAAGATRELNLRIGISDAHSYTIPAEIQYAFNEDPDSTPYNRLSNPDEDDTAILTLYTTNNKPPLLTNNGSAASSSINFPENSTATIIDLDAEDPDGESEGNGLSWTIAGGLDAQFFTLDSMGKLKFQGPRNYESPEDNDADNSYEVMVKVCDSYAGCDTQDLTVNITDVSEDGDGDNVPGNIETRIGSDPEKVDTDGDGIDDNTEIGSDYDNPLDTDGDGTPDVLDTDDDGDGILTINENPNGGSPADDDTDGDGKPNYLDADDDNDGILTQYENYNGGLPVDDDTDKDGIADYLDSDDDNDGIPTASENPDLNNDGRPTDATDTEGDSIPDYLDWNNNAGPGDDSDGDGLTDEEELAAGSDPFDNDSDNDGVPDGVEYGPDGEPLDSDQDGIIDSMDTDDDNDGILTVDENYNGGTPLDDNSDRDSKPDYLDDDDDNDSILTRFEDYNGNDARDDDTDSDGIPDYLDIDDDGDGLWTWYENYNAALPLDDDTDNDGVPDYLDTDDDGDGLLTKHEQGDPNANGNPDDGVDTDQDGLKNYRDADDDNDGLLTRNENADPDGNKHPEDAVDLDLDGIAAYLDPENTPYVKVRLRAFLQGPYIPQTGLMTDLLRQKNYLPKQQPYSSLQTSYGYGADGHEAPFGYTGDEVASDAVLATEGENAVVDWLLIEARNANDPTDVLAATTALVQRDGDLIIPSTGERDLVISGVDSGDYYVVIRHRNHLGVMTNAPVALSKTTVHEYDFSSSDIEIAGSHGRTTIDSTQLMWSGDLNYSNSVIAEGPGSDMLVLLGAVLVAPSNTEANANYPLNGYYASDLNLDGQSIYTGPNNDINLLIGNVLLHPGNLTSPPNFNFLIGGGAPDPRNVSEN